MFSYGNAQSTHWTCETAQGIDISSLPYTEDVDASASPDDGTVPDCEFYTGQMNDGVWYTFTGTGNAVSIALTNVVNWEDPKIGVYTGSCETLTCVDFASNYDDPDNVYLTISTTAGVTYFINIASLYNFKKLLGQFTLTVENGLIHQSCNNAKVISSSPYIDKVNATSSAADGFILSCSPGMNDGVWYTFTGTGKSVNIKLKNNGGWDPEIGVYTGSCGAFTCVGSADNGNGNNQDETLTIETTAGIPYFINIGQFEYFLDKPEGRFTITVTGNTLGTTSFNDSVFQFYPNPVKDILHLSYNAIISNVSVFNLLGQKVLTKTINANEAKIDMTHLPNGTYTVKVAGGNESKTIKIVKQ